jgi:crotonobetainyl-CoA:carnitine CoA-transferase CaiB-like acyl-CoA transferase
LLNPLADAPVAAAAPGFPIKFSAAQASYDAPAPRPGAHTAEVLARLAGVGDGDLERLHRTGVI